MRLLKIGRDSGCDIVLGSHNVSSLHAEITLLNSGDIMLEDKGSQNGTYIMGQRIKPGKAVKVKRGDRIQFADMELQWSQVPMPEDNSAYRAIFGIGSHFSNEIQVSGTTVSRYHATIKCGKDGKIYIIDHSKNGTTVNGAKITPNNPYRITKKSSIACGGVPVNLKNNHIIPWPKNIWKSVACIAAVLAVVAGLGFGIYKIINNGTYSDKELYAMHHNDVVMLRGIYHFELEIGGLSDEDVAALGYPKKMLYGGGGGFLDVSEFTTKQLVEALDKKGLYGGSGFFISNDGQLITNLHVVKPWLFGSAKEDMIALENNIRKHFAKKTQDNDFIRHIHGVTASTLSAYISQISIKGVLDYIALVPQGEIFDAENIIKCKVLSAGDDPNKDVALIQTITKRLPTPDCTYVDLMESLDDTEEAIMPGEHVYTLGFPMGTDDGIQKEKDERGIQAVGQGGSIIQKDSEYEFTHNASTYGGASGSPIYNKYGKIIGVHHAGYSQNVTQGYNFGIKAKYVKELITSPHVK